MVAGESRGSGMLDDYQLHLPSFEGPLDLLLRLIERQKLPIADISLVAVAGQFLAYVADNAVPPATLADFATVGARLVLLKTRSLLPRAPRPDGDEEPDDLVHRLVEYRAIRDAARDLAETDRAGGRAYAVPPRRPAVKTPPATTPLAPHEATSLARAIRRRLSLLSAPVTTHALAPVVSLRQMVSRLADLLRGGRSLAFTDFVAPDRPRQERLIGFLAVLVLVRQRAVDAVQDDLFGPIAIRLLPAGPGTSTDATVIVPVDDLG
ncbi:MAG: segregation/condensation protein A [Chloroflexia bacterium]|nr:segregation/condensation protein A [Chloroflexia bacterium]MDQ3512450.1 segregation/condensation protein A [Chloroflexota bacterium]